MSENVVLANIEKHLCYSHSARFKYGRIHLPVAPECNLGCNYCERRIGGVTYHSYRPAVTDRILTPEEALSEVAQYVGMRDSPWLELRGRGNHPIIPITIPN